MICNLFLLTNPTLYKTLSIVCAVGAVLCAIFVCIVVLVQPGNSNGIGALGGNQDTFYNRDKCRSLESKLKRLTFVCLGLMALFMIGFYVLEVLLPL